MLNNNFLSVFLKRLGFGVSILVVTASFLPLSRAQSLDPDRVAELQISTAKEEFLLGEPVTLQRLFINLKDGSRRFLEEDRQGPLRVFISKDGSEFKRYRFAVWNSLDQEFSDGPGRYKVSHTIFFNKKPETAHLSAYGRREAERGMILTDYAFPEPGEYRIKATLVFLPMRETDRNASLPVVDSNEITIRVKEPRGDDLKVWEIMKAKPRIGFFMTNGEAPYRVPSIQDLVLAEVDKIVSDYPDSYLAGLLKLRAQEHRARQELRKQEAEKEGLKKEKTVSPSSKN